MSTEFIHGTNLITQNGELVDEHKSPIIQSKKLNGQGTIYKLTDANIESINAERENRGIINVDKFIRSVRTHFGNGRYLVSGITHLPLPNQLRELGMLRVEVNGKVAVTPSQHHWDEVEDHSIFIYMQEGVVLDLNSWYGFIKKAHENNEVGDQFLELCDKVMEEVPAQTSHFFEDTMFDKHLDTYDKICVMRDRVYD